MPEKQSNKDRLKEITDNIEAGIKDLFESEKFQKYLTTMSRFHNYSVNNTILIHMQRPDATLVAGYNKWQDKFQRHVKKGEKGIQIIAPMTYKKKVEDVKIDPDTLSPVKDRHGNIVMEEKEVRLPWFKPVKVFDISQTDGKPLPQIVSDLTGNVQQYEAFMEALRQSSPVPLEIKSIESNVDGFFSPKDQSITIREGMSEVQTVCAAVHEIAHSKLHNYEKLKEEAAVNGDLLDPIVKKDRHTEEVEAESIAYVVCKYYGIETSENSFGYIATWSESKELKELKASLETINKTSSKLIDDIDRNYKEICKERGINLSPKETESLYLVDDLLYLHIQETENGWDYSLYEKGSSSVLDGGILNAPEISDLSEACSEIMKLTGISPGKTEKTDLSVLDDILQSSPLPAASADFPDLSLSFRDMYSAGYAYTEMLPLSKERAMELFLQNTTIYALHQDNTESMIMDTDAIQKHGGLFGIERADWERFRGEHDREQQFLQKSDDAYAIYQLRDDAPRELHFSAYERLTVPPNPVNYRVEYIGELPDGDTAQKLESLYSTFNLNHPVDFTGHSLSVSDIIALKEGDRVSYHYCDDIGFRELPNFRHPENYLKIAEMSMEDDYNMIDGVINNGRSPVEEQKEKKPSVLEQLKSKPEAERVGKTMVKKTKEREI